MTNTHRFFHFVSLVSTSPISIQKARSRRNATMPEETPPRVAPDRKKIVQYLSQHVHATSPLPKDNHQRKLQTKLDGLFHRLRDERDDDGEENMVEILSQTALTLQEQAERLSMMSSEKEEEENGNVVEGLHLKACKAYEVAAKMKEACEFECLLGVR